MAGSGYALADSHEAADHPSLAGNEVRLDTFSLQERPEFIVVAATTPTFALQRLTFSTAAAGSDSRRRAAKSITSVILPPA
jgi:hypothetical protein